MGIQFTLSNLKKMYEVFSFKNAGVVIAALEAL